MIKKYLYRDTIDMYVMLLATIISLIVNAIIIVDHFSPFRY